MDNERTQWAARMLTLLEPLKSRLTPGGSGFALGATAAHYETATIPMEAFSRPLWALVPFWAGGGHDAAWEEIYRRGLVSGTTPGGPGYWGSCRDLDQKFVEMAAIAYGLLLTPDVLWDPLTDTERENLAKWLDNINHYECSHSNWQFFCILVNSALKKRGMTYNKERLELGLARIDSYYDTHGWYFDGKGGMKDYYNGFAIVFYSLLYAMTMQQDDPARCEKFRARACKFAQDFIYWFDENGAAVAYGRSQTYRFAQAAFFSLCAAAELPVFTPGVIKGIVTRHLDWWAAQPITDNGGVLTIGYAYPNLMMSENYNAPGSPYWCMKAFAFLMLPAAHPFWQAPAEPLPALDAVRPLPGAEMLAQRVNGMAVLYPAALRVKHPFPQMEEKYAKLAYCSRYAFSAARSQRTLEEAAPDSVLSFRYLGHIFVKAAPESWEMTENGTRAVWSPLPGVQVVTELLLCKGGHLRRHTVASEIACEAFDAGFAVPDDCPGAAHSCTVAAARAEHPGGFCAVEDLTGRGTPLVLEPMPNTSLQYPRTVIPMVQYAIYPGTTVLETKVTFA